MIAVVIAAFVVINLLSLCLWMGVVVAVVVAVHFGRSFGLFVGLEPDPNPSSNPPLSLCVGSSGQKVRRRIPSSHRSIVPYSHCIQ